MSEANEGRTPPWYLDELGYAGPEHLDAAYVAGYDAKSQTDPSEDVALLRELGLSVSSTLVDLGAGTGTLALAIAPYCRRVVAVDPSPAMLAAMRAAGPAPNVELVRAGFLSYQHSGEPADFVYSRNALHHLPDFWKALALVRIADLLRPGGTFVLRDLIYDFSPREGPAVVEAWLAKAAQDPARGFTREDLETHLRHEYSTFSWLLEPMLERAGFAIRQASHRPSRTYSLYVLGKSDSA